MKKILISMVLAIPLLFANKVMAQSNPQLPDFQADVTVVSQYALCDNPGQMTGYVPPLGNTYSDYDHGRGYYNLLWCGNFPGYQPCTVEVTTDVNEYGEYCHGKNTKDLSLYDNDITVELFPEAINGGGGGDPQ